MFRTPAMDENNRDMTPTPRPVSPSTGSPRHAAAAGVIQPSATSLRKSISVDALSGRSTSTPTQQPQQEPSPTTPASTTSVSRAGSSKGPSRSRTIDPAVVDPMWNYEYPGEASTFFKKLASGEISEEILMASGALSDSVRSAGEESADIDDSDLDRQNGMSRLKAKVKGKAKASRSTVAPGELLLPSRAPALSNASSVSSTRSSPRYATDSSVPPTPPVPQAHQRRLNIPAPLQLADSRNGSTTATNGPMPASQSHDFIIAVIGAARCGKSTLIRKGFKWWDIGAGEPFAVVINDQEAQIVRYFVTVKISGQMRSVKILEIDSALILNAASNWPDGLESIDGTLVCYDQTQPSTANQVVDLLRRMRAIRPLVGVIAVGCKTDIVSDLPVQLYGDASDLNIGLVQVMNKNHHRNDIDNTRSYSEKTRQCCYWLLLAINRYRRGDQTGTTNPASPEVLQQLRTMPSSPSSHRVRPASTGLPLSSISPPRSPPVPTSPTSRNRSNNDLLNHSQAETSDGGPPTDTGNSAALQVDNGVVRSRSDEPQDAPKKEVPPLQWATLDQLLDKLFFLAVSGDDKTFIRHFFLTYRRFATPRSVLLGMQKRMRQLAQEELDPLLAKFAQMKICNLLDQWVNDYPCDFATPGTAGALSALLKQMISHVHTAHYGSELLPFLEELPVLRDEETTWSIKIEDARDESDEEGDEETIPQPSTEESESDVQNGASGGRERKGSVAGSLRAPGVLGAALAQIPTAGTTSTSSARSLEESRLLGPDAKPTSKPNYKELSRTANAVVNLEPSHLAQEITRVELQLFWAIEPRHWLRHTLGKQRDPEDPIARMARFFNYLSMWVTTLIVCHDKPRNRAKVMERFAYVARALRQQNNYSGLRAVVTGINNARVEGCQVSEIVQSKQIWKVFQSLEVLLGSTRMHGAYRMALRHTVGPAIPDMEIHTVDLFRSHETNPDFHPDDPEKIHWGKFALLGKLISNVSTFQDRTRAAPEYEPAERPGVYDLLVGSVVMDEHTLNVRVEAGRGAEAKDASAPAPRYPFPSQPVIHQESPAPTKSSSVFRKPGRFFFGGKES